MKKKIKSWPKINISFHKVNFLWKPANYFYQLTQNEACLGINNHSFKHIIFGINFMRGNDIIFDKERNRIGFVEADCANISSINKPIYNNTNQTNEQNGKRRNNVLLVKDGIEFIRGKNKELKNIKEYKTFNKIINIIFYSLITFVTCFILLITWIIYRIYKRKRQYIGEEHKKLSQFDNDC